MVAIVIPWSAFRVSHGKIPRQAFLEVWESVVQMAAPGDKGESSPQVMDAQMHSCWVGKLGK